MIEKRQSQQGIRQQLTVRIGIVSLLTDVAKLNDKYAKRFSGIFPFSNNDAMAFTESAVATRNTASKKTFRQIG